MPNPHDNDTWDPWTWGTGMPSWMEGDITDAWFQASEDSTKVNAHFYVQTDDPDIGEAGKYEIRLGVGSDDEWEVVEKGTAIRNRKSERRPLNNNCGYVAFIDSALAQGVDLAARGSGTPFAVDIWPGVHGTFAPREFTRTIRGEEAKWTWMLFEDTAPADADGVPTPATTTGKKATPVKKAAAPRQAAQPTAAATSDATAAAVASNGGGGGLAIDGVPMPKIIALSALAKSTDTHPAFMEAAFGTHTDLLGNEQFEAAIMDSSGAGFYATARA